MIIEKNLRKFRIRLLFNCSKQIDLVPPPRLNNETVSHRSSTTGGCLPAVAAVRSRFEVREIFAGLESICVVDPAGFYVC